MIPAFIIALVICIHVLQISLQNTGVLGAHVFLADKGESDAEVQKQETPDVQKEKVDIKEPVEPAQHKSLEVQSENGHTQVNLEQNGMHVELSTESGNIQIKAKNENNGTEIQLSQNALTTINEALKKKDIEVSTSSANGFTVTKGNSAIQTHFPLSINPITQQLTVTTPNSSKIVTVLPDQAVQNILSRGILDKINQISTGGTQSANISNLVLTEYGSQPVYQAQGSVDTKLFGFIPVSYDRTAYVSAFTGELVGSSQSTISKLIQALSF